MSRMRVRHVLVATLACAASLATGGCGDHLAGAADGPAPQRVAVAAGVSTIRPPGWRLLAPPIASIGHPVERLLLTSYATRRGGNCAPDRAERDLPADGALVYLIEYRPRVGSVWAHLKRADFPPLPAHVALRRRDVGSYECWRVPSYLIRFRAAGRPFQLHVALGPRASAARRAQVRRIIDGLRVSALPAPPPDPYAGWHALHDEAGHTA
jgi:hypothetical protein